MGCYEARIVGRGVAKYVLQDHPESAHGSPWPIALAASCTLLAIGIVSPLDPIFGVVAIVLSLVGWVKEALRPHHAVEPVTPRDASDAVLYLIASEVVLFGALFFYWFWARAHGAAWGRVDVESLPVLGLNTVFLLTSGWTAHAAHKALKLGQDRKFRGHVAATVLLGLAFLGGQAYEYTHLRFTPSTGPYGSAFYGLTGIHGLHVAAGLAALGFALVAAVRGALSTRHERQFGALALYWHFVDAVWLVILAVVYLEVI